MDERSSAANRTFPSLASSLWLLTSVVIAGILYVNMTSAGLPDVLATHFDARGEPNDFMTVRGYRLFMTAMMIFVPFMIAVLPRIVGSRWPQLLNIPNRGYWLAPERQAATLETVFSRTTQPAVATVGLMCFVHWLLMDAHTNDPPRLDSGLLWAGLLAFVGFTIVWMVSFYARFRRPQPPS